MLFEQAELHALALSTFAEYVVDNVNSTPGEPQLHAGLSTSVGATVAVVRRPDDATLAFLLGLALGVMATLSVVELWINNALENGVLPVTVATLAGAAAYYLIQPYFPDFEVSDVAASSAAEEATVSGALGGSPSSQTVSNPTRRAAGALAVESQESVPGTVLAAGSAQGSSIPPSELLRLGFLMALTMTLHNMPEGLAVAFSSYTDLGPVMATAIAMHNIPEGIIVAAPIFAATGSRVKALGVATLSGLSEPLGALIALVFVKPVLTAEWLHCVLAFTGGVMLAVCVVELWPEARKCKQNTRAWQGVALGAVVMAVTLAADV